MLLCSQRLTLKPLDNSDKSLFIEMVMCPKIMAHCYDPSTYEDAEASFARFSKPWDPQSDDWLCFGISDLNSGEKIGNISIKIINHEARIAEVGFLICTAQQGKGFAFEALSMVKEYTFNNLKMNKLVAVCSVNNTGSIKLLEKSRFAREGRLKQNALINNQLVDDYSYGLCSEDANLK